MHKRIEDMPDSIGELCLKFIREMEATIGRKINDLELSLAIDLFNADLVSGLVICTNCNRRFDIVLDTGILSDNYILCRECYLKDKSPKIVNHRNKHRAGQEKLEADTRRLLDEANIKSGKVGFDI